MELPVDSWYRAIFVRKSRRSYDDRPVDPAVLEGFGPPLRGGPPFSGARIGVVARRPEAVLRGLVGNYGRITGAPAYAAFIGDIVSPGAPAAVGYIGEALIWRPPPWAWRPAGSVDFSVPPPSAPISISPRPSGSTP